MEITEISSLETLCDEQIHIYYDLLEIPIEDIPERFKAFHNQLIWINILKNVNVHRTLLLVFNQHQDNNNDDRKLISTETKKQLEESPKIILIAAVSLLQLFVIQNFVFKISDSKPFKECLHFVEDFLSVTDKDLNIEAIDYSLDVDDATVFHLARNPELLKLSRFIFNFLLNKKSDTFKNNPVENLYFLIWTMRSSIIHQISLNKSTGTLFNELLNLITKFDPFLNDEQINNSLKLNILAEILNNLFYFGCHEEAQKYLLIANKYSTISYDLIGRLGVRTKFQTKSLPQLTIDLKRLAEYDLNGFKNVEIKIPMPTNEPLEDNTLLQEVKFTDTILKNEEIKLNPIEQAIMIASLNYSRKFNGSNDPIKNEENQTYIYFLLNNCDEWIMQFSLLTMRSIDECNLTRFVERSLKQFETLMYIVNDHNELKDLTDQASQRMRYFYSVLSVPFWTIKELYAEMLEKLGLFKAALDIYTELNIWRKILFCYRKLGLESKAEELIKEKLTINDNQPDLHCLLGDITGDIKHYEYSWKISGGRYALAKKMLGYHYLNIKDYHKALECFRETVNINSFQPDVWFRMGFIGLEIKDYDLAVTANRKVVQFDLESYEAWNNLSKAYFKLGKKQMAMKTLEEAIRQNYDEWKLWENYITISADQNNINGTINAWHRLIDIKGSYLDDTIAGILVQYCTLHSSFVQKCLELFGRITSTSPGTAKTWNCYARLLLLKNRGEENIDKIEQCLQKSQRQIIKHGWEKDINKINTVMEHYQSIAETIFAVVEVYPEKEQHFFKLFKPSLNTILSQVRKTKDELMFDDDKWSEIGLDVLEKKLQVTYDQIDNKLKQCD